VEKLPRDVFGSATGLRLDPALKDRACGAQEGQMRAKTAAVVCLKP
jgi:hypothetical protein